MKLKIPFAGTLLLAYVVYTTFVPVSISHSIILFSLAAFAGFELYVQSHQLPSIKKTVEDLRTELFKEMQIQKETHEAKLQELEDEQSRQALIRANSSSSSKPKPSPIKF